MILDLRVGGRELAALLSATIFHSILWGSYVAEDEGSFDMFAEDIPPAV